MVSLDGEVGRDPTGLVKLRDLSFMVRVESDNSSDRMLKSPGRMEEASKPATTSPSCSISLFCQIRGLSLPFSSCAGG